MQLLASRIRCYYSRCSYQSCTFSQRLSSTWAANVSDSSSQFQTYQSRSTDPFFNLSVEHYLFQKSPPGSKVLFLYSNRPCIVIGRNQNPWLEVNLSLLRPETKTESDEMKLPSVDLVRRRSGGGSVFHDSGNVNWSVICDMNEFTRDKHAEMVVRALRSRGIGNARVNERHDIVLDQGMKGPPVDDTDTHATAYTDTAGKFPPLKVSGSAYKLARNRALHHGTALCHSPNLGRISQYLRSPAKPFITAKGVESVSSPVGNIGIRSTDFEKAVCEEFSQTYARERNDLIDVSSPSLLEIPEIRKGYDELTSPEWTFLQTPQFSISNQPVKAGTSELEKEQIFSINVRYGIIQDVQWGSSKDERVKALPKNLVNLKLHEIEDWDVALRKISSGRDLDGLISFLRKMLPPSGGLAGNQVHRA